MKRVLAILLVLLMLSGCAEREQAEPAPAPEKTPAVEEKVPSDPAPAPEPEPVPEPAPAPEPEPEPAPEPVPEPKPEPKPEPEPEPEPAPDWAAAAAEVCEAITGQQRFYVLVEEPTGMVTGLTIRQGENDGNVEHLTGGIADYTWTPAAKEDWLAQEASAERGAKLTLYTPENLSITCCQGGTVVEVQDGAVFYVRAVLEEGQGPYGTVLYGLLDGIAEDAIDQQIWNSTADGALTPDEAARALMENVTEIYRALPDWVSWKPLDIQADSAVVYDVYRGMPEEFCFNMTVHVWLKDQLAPESVYWQSGAGLDMTDGAETYSWSRQVLVQKNDAGDWSIMDWGTGGLTVLPGFPWDSATPAQLVEAFCLTEGLTHDTLVPNRILELMDEEIAALPAILDQLTESEARALCTALGKCVRESDSWRWSIDLLAPLLGDYGIWLDA